MMFVAGVQLDAGGNIIIYKNKTDTEGEVPCLGFLVYF